MTTIETSATTIQLPDHDFAIDDARLAAVAFLARYSGRTLDALPPRSARVLPVGGRS